jgi:hypothetical protein
MGKANATCHGGCTCKEQTINGHIVHQHSIPRIGKFEVSCLAAQQPPAQGVLPRMPCA